MPAARRAPRGDHAGGRRQPADGSSRAGWGQVTSVPPHLTSCGTRDRGRDYKWGARYGWSEMGGETADFVCGYLPAAASRVVSARNRVARARYGAITTRDTL